MTERDTGVFEEALFRHQVVSEVGSRVLAGIPVTQAIAEVREQRWDADERELVLPPEGWQQHFVITFDRKVSNDNVISYNSVDYEVPRGSAGRTITVSRHLLDDNALTVIDQGRVVTLHPVDLTANAHARRARRSSAADAFSAKPQQSAAAARFDADMEPMVASDGGYKKGQDDEE
jgi:hypothetical protein